MWAHDVGWNIRYASNWYDLCEEIVYYVVTFIEIFSHYAFFILNMASVFLILIAFSLLFQVCFKDWTKNK